MFNLNHIITRFQQSNEKAYYMAFLRVAVSIWFIKEMIFRWPALETLYSNKSFLSIAPESALYIFRLDAFSLKEHYMLIVYAGMFLLVLNILGIGRNVVSILLFLTFTLLNSINNKFTNSGDKMAMLLLFYLSLANTFSYFTIFKRRALSPSKEKLYNLFSNLAAYSILINLCLVYFMAGVHKLVDPYWQKGIAVHYFLNDDRYSVFAAGGKYVEAPAFILHIMNYGALLTELSFPVLVWFRKSRKPLLIACLLMHLYIYSFMLIYGMTLVFIMQYGLFYKNEEVTRAAEKIKSFFKRRQSTV